MERMCAIRRPPDPEGRTLIAILNRALRLLCPDLGRVLRRKRTTILIAETEVLAGTLCEYVWPSERTVVFSARLFGRDFAEALAVYLHEHAHIFGGDGCPAFTNALTYVLEVVVRQRRKLTRYERAWRHHQLER